jgi:hypothetical protein
MVHVQKWDVKKELLDQVMWLVFIVTIIWNSKLLVVGGSCLKAILSIVLGGGWFVSTTN